VFSLIPKLDMESRRVFFLAVAKGAQDGVSEITTAGIAAGVLRSPQVVDLCARLGIPSGELLEALRSVETNSLGPEGRGEGSAAATPETTFMSKREEPEAQVGASGMLAALRLSAEAQTFLESLTVEFENLTEESVTPSRLLASLLDHDGDVRDVCANYGLTSVQLRASA
jgi:hypothetical protein